LKSKNIIGKKNIRTFLIKSNYTRRKNYELSFYETTQLITSHSDLLNYWIKIQDILKSEYDKNESDTMEIIDLIRILEQRYLPVENRINFKNYYNDDGTPKNGNFSFATGKYIL